MLLNNLDVFANNIRNNIPTIDSGGCGVFAYHIAKRLENYVPLKIRVISDSRNKRIDGIRNRILSNEGDTKDILEWNWYDLHFHHILIEFHYMGKDYLYDSTGVYLKRNYPIQDYGYLCHGSLTLKELEYLVSGQTGWNRYFDRQAHIPFVKRKVKQFFRKFVNVGKMYYPPRPVRN